MQGKVMCEDEENQLLILLDDSGLHHGRRERRILGEIPAAKKRMELKIDLIAVFGIGQDEKIAAVVLYEQLGESPVMLSK